MCVCVCAQCVTLDAQSDVELNPALFLREERERGSAEMGRGIEGRKGEKRKGQRETDNFLKILKLKNRLQVQVTGRYSLMDILLLLF